jgi:hypothetical protein
MSTDRTSSDVELTPDNLQMVLTNQATVLQPQTQPVAAHFYAIRQGLPPERRDGWKLFLADQCTAQPVSTCGAGTLAFRPAVDDVDEVCFTKLTNSKPIGTLEMYGNTSA